MKKLFVVLLITLAAGVYSQQNAAPQKYALVIGNGTYANFGSLRNAVNDANDVADALQGLGFTVDKLLNGNLNQMENAAIRLKSRLSGSRNSYGFLFYAGHGVQLDGVNYLIPADANIPDRNFLRDRTVSVQAVLDMLNEAGNALNIVVLDACRDFPATWSRTANRGLAVIPNPPADSIIMFATGPGQTASDGAGRNGLFTQHLLSNLKTPGLEVTEVFRKTGADVARASERQQLPAMNISFYETAYLGSRPVASAPVQPTPAPTPAATTPAAVPQRPVPDNFVRINGGTFTMGSPANEPERFDREGPQHQVTVSSFYMGKYEVTQKEYRDIMGSNPSKFKGDNLPVEQVSWYDAIDYCNKRSQREGLTLAYTIDKSSSDTNNFSKEDKYKYAVTWNRNANGYRLPTEAEWEYACRAGTTTAYNTGSAISDATGWYDANSGVWLLVFGGKTNPVGQKPANAWGLYDMHGNVWEWCWDWYESYSSGAQTEPTGASSGSDRVERSGSWYSIATYLRSAFRSYGPPSSRNHALGFRVVRNGQ